MDLQTVTAFFMWCTILNVALFAVATIFMMIAPDFVYRVQSRFVAVPRDTQIMVMYGFLGVYKLLIIVFNLVPYLALLIIG